MRPILYRAVAVLMAGAVLLAAGMLKDQDAAVGAAALVAGILLWDNRWTERALAAHRPLPRVAHALWILPAAVGLVVWLTVQAGPVDRISLSGGAMLVAVAVVELALQSWAWRRQLPAEPAA